MYSLSKDIRIYVLHVRFVLQMSIKFLLGEKLLKDVNEVSLEESITSHSSFKD